jgi:AraC family ethanolamine operon transcriptional activator
MKGSSRRRQRRRDAKASRQEVVERAEAYVRTHGDSTVPLSTLCRIVGLSERGLRNAFYSVRGMGPKRYMLVERLEAVRRALSDPRTRPTTVTGVATEHGFYELGRFAASYREAFGEAPSETLRGAGRKSVLERTLHSKGHADACTS